MLTALATLIPLTEDTSDAREELVDARRDNDAPDLVDPVAPLATLGLRELRLTVRRSILGVLLVLPAFGE